MLDLISNSLAAVIILFIVISSLRIPFIPPERIVGTLYIRVEFKSKTDSEGSLESTIWMVPPPNPTAGKARFWGSEIMEMNADPSVFGPFSDCGEDFETRKSKGFITPCIIEYSPEDSANVHYIIIRGPLREKWRIGTLYVDHQEITSSEQAVSVHYEAWLIRSEHSMHHRLDTVFTAPTGNHFWIIDLSTLEKRGNS